jgi:hypothetical protein
MIAVALNGFRIYPGGGAAGDLLHRSRDRAAMRKLPVNQSRGRRPLDVIAKPGIEDDLAPGMRAATQRGQFSTSIDTLTGAVRASAESLPEATNDSLNPAGVECPAPGCASGTTSESPPPRRGHGRAQPYRSCGTVHRPIIRPVPRPFAVPTFGALVVAWRKLPFHPGLLGDQLPVAARAMSPRCRPSGWARRSSVGGTGTTASG